MNEAIKYEQYMNNNDYADSWLLSDDAVCFLIKLGKILGSNNFILFYKKCS